MDATQTCYRGNIRRSTVGSAVQAQAQAQAKGDPAVQIDEMLVKTLQTLKTADLA